MLLGNQSINQSKSSIVPESSGYRPQGCCQSNKLKINNPGTVRGCQWRQNGMQEETQTRNSGGLGWESKVKQIERRRGTDWSGEGCSTGVAQRSWNLYIHSLTWYRTRLASDRWRNDEYKKEIGKLTIEWGLHNGCHSELFSMAFDYNASYRPVSSCFCVLYMPGFSFYCWQWTMSRLLSKLLSKWHIN